MSTEGTSPEPMRVTISDPGYLRVCICGTHKDGHIPIEQLENARVAIYYKDTDNIIKPWIPPSSPSEYDTGRNK